MAPKPKYQEVVKIITRRINAGDYCLKSLPGERRIADITGVSYMTARKAVNELLNTGVLERQDNGTLNIHPHYNRKLGKTHVVLLYPSYPSHHLNQCRTLISDNLADQDAAIRPMQYTHWDDPIILEALDNAHGVILIANTEPITQNVLNELNSNNHKVVIFDSDFTQHNIPSIQMFPEQHLLMLFDKIAKKWGSNIDLLNTQGHDVEIQRRLRIWQQWASSQGINTQIWDDPSPAFTDSRERSYKFMKRITQEKLSSANAFICTTQDVAVGAIRACHDIKINIGKDLAIAAFNIGSDSRYFYPSITGLDFPDIHNQLLTCLKWFSSSEKDWNQPLLLASDIPQLFLCESTGH
ncbi:lac repressor [Poriferisphaera corsica]|uniref:Lac repressor n=1 Tax=Poriferisphaera corsica TaxID=2528020 RepID=A0A517YSW3_9BACT|nr:substrate-binding domain-containing protein [Poriferisphaera corsica]QDU33294.1 lac repressor [Poriferisphaera corsica]